MVESVKQCCGQLTRLMDRILEGFLILILHGGSSKFLSHDQFQARPDVVDSANFDINESE